MMLEIKPHKISTKDLHQHLLSSVGPRPIALASTIDLNGYKNVSPFSFFNIFSANPPIAIFSPARRVRNNTIKDTLSNIREVKEVVINIVNFDLVEKSSLSSGEYPKKDDEFLKAGLTPIPSKKIKPFRVKESPVQMECKVNQIIELGKEGGAGNLIVCEIVLIHIHKEILNNKGQIDPNKIQLVGRMGQNWYCKGFNEGLFEIQKPTKELGIGFDQIPEMIQKSTILSNSDLTKLASTSNLPSKKEIEDLKKSKEYQKIINTKNSPINIINQLHLKAKNHIKKGDLKQAWRYLLIDILK